jgi:magnesium and cobalt transporter
MCWFTSVDCEDRDKTAEAIMIPAERVDFISLARTFEENLALARKSMHTRFPLCRNGLDSALAIVSMKDLWPLLQVEKSNAVFERVSRPLIKIPLDFSQDKILKLFQEGRGHMGVVRDLADEKTLGIVTLEDVLESLLGDLREVKHSATTPLKQSA